MSRTRSYYELLGVSHTATPSEIRRAYVRLMKRHHPDAATRDHDAPDLAPIVNRCYATLRDPAKRARYDARLLSLAPTPPPRLNHSPTRSTSGDSWKVAASLSGGIVVVLFALALHEPIKETSNDVFATAVGWPWPESGFRTPEVDVPLPGTTDVRRMAGLARSLSVREAETFSRECFADAGRQLKLGAADSCVLFDVAFLYWRATPEVGRYPAHFADQVVTYRHREVMIPFGQGAEARLGTLRQAAFAGLVEAMPAAPPEPVNPLHVAGAAVASQESDGSEERSPEPETSHDGTFSIEEE